MGARQVSLANNDIQIVMLPALGSQQSVDTPAPVEPALDARFPEALQDLRDIRCSEVATTTSQNLIHQLIIPRQYAITQCRLAAHGSSLRHPRGQLRELATGARGQA